MTAAFGRILERIVDRHATVVIAVFAILGAAAIVPASKVRIDPAFEAMMLRDDPDLVRNNAMKADFSSDEAVVLALDFGRPFDADDLRLVRDLSEELAAVEGVEEVLDLATIEDIRGDEDVIDGSPLVDFDKLPADLGRIRERVAGHRLYERNLLSPEQDVLVLIVIPEYDDAKRSIGIELTGRVMPVAESARERCNCEVHVSGYGPSIWDANRILQRDFALLGALAMSVVTAINFLVYRSWVAVLLTIVTVLWSLAVTIAWFGATGTAITIPCGPLTPMVSAIASAYAIYVLGMLQLTSGEPRPGTALIDHLVRPTFVSSLSSIAGFASLNLLPVEGIANLGTALSIAVASCAAVSLLLAPALVNRFNARIDRSAAERPFSRFAVLGVRFAARPWTTVAVASAIVVAIGSGIAQLRVETDAIHYWHPDSAFRVAQEFTNDRVSGTQTMNVVIRTGEPDRALDPEVMRFAAELERRLDASPIIDRTISFLDYVYLMDGVLNPGAEPRSVLPTRAMAAQYMLLYEGGGDPADYRHYINFDRSALNVFGRLNHWNSRKTLGLRDRLSTYAADHAPEGVEVDVVGTQVLTVKTHEHVASSMVKGLIAATVAITLMMIATLRSVRLGLVAMIPNVIPIVMCGGVAGWLGETVSVGTSIVGCIALGLAVDDTAHVLGHLERGTSLEAVYSKIGRPLIVTTLSVGAGFLVMVFGEFAAVSTTGIATALTLLAAVTTDLLLLPSLLELVGWERLVADAGPGASTGETIAATRA